MKITAYPEDTSPANNDLLLTVDVSNGANRKVTVTNLINTIADIANLPVNGWYSSTSSVSSVTYNGNRSYTMVTGTNLSSTLSTGMRLRTTRTVSAPTQCTSLNGSNQYFNKTSPAGMTFTDDFTVMAWIKLNAYPTTNPTAIIGRTNAAATLGWQFRVETTGQIALQGLASGVNELVTSYQSVPLNKWVHVAATLDMSGNAGNVYIDGVLVPSTYATPGAGTALTQSGDLVIGYFQGGSYFNGKIAQAAIFSAIISASTIRSYISQGLAGNETSLISAYSLSNSVNDLNTSNANNLTAQNSATTTNADSPFGYQADGTISSTLDYSIIQKVSGTTLTLQVPEGNTIPTSGGVSSIAYSNFKAPYNFTLDKTAWEIEMLILTTVTASGSTTGTYYNPGGVNLNVPVGDWVLSARITIQQQNSTQTADTNVGISTSTSSLTDSKMSGRDYIAVLNTGSFRLFNFYASRNITLSVATPYYITFNSATALASTSLIWANTVQGSVIVALPSGI